MRPRANLRRRLHDLHLAPTLYAPQRADERLERPPLPLRRGNNVQICLRLRFVKRGPRISEGLAAREVFEEEPRSRGAPMLVAMLVVVTMMSVVGVASGSGQVGVHVFAVQHAQRGSVGRLRRCRAGACRRRRRARRRPRSA